MLKTSSEVISLLRITVYLAKVACSARNIYIKNADTEVASIKDTCIRDAYTRTASIRGTGDAFIEATSIRSTYIKDICSDGAYIGPGTCFRDAWIEDTSATSDIGVFKDLGIHLQWFQILELK